MEYNFQEIEKKWQEYWDKNETFKTDVWNFSKPKFYALDMFPYPSGQGLHVGHPEGYTATDIVSRMKRMQGYNVLHPMGWDAFGLPAEQYAIKTGHHPSEFTKANIETFKKQLKMLGLSFDWDKEISTCDPNYYKWTQWIFKQLYNDGLAKLIDMPVNWCEELGTVLSISVFEAASFLYFSTASFCLADVIISTISFSGDNTQYVAPNKVSHLVVNTVKLKSSNPFILNLTSAPTDFPIQFL